MLHLRTLFIFPEVTVSHVGLTRNPLPLYRCHRHRHHQPRQCFLFVGLWDSSSIKQSGMWLLTVFAKSDEVLIEFKWRCPTRVSFSSIDLSWLFWCWWFLCSSPDTRVCCRQANTVLSGWHTLTIWSLYPLYSGFCYFHLFYWQRHVQWSSEARTFWVAAGVHFGLSDPDCL